MNSRIVFAAAVAVALVVGIGIGIWYALRERPSPFCELSGRPIHSNMRTVVEVDGKRLQACCARCALTLASQTDQPVHILEVTDYASGRTLKADKAWFVDGSQVQVCAMPRGKLNGERQAYERLFDRCVPSLIAFAQEDEARAFMAKYGGSLKRLDELVREATAKPLPAGEQ
jgi:hypothetical protein